VKLATENRLDGDVDTWRQERDVIRSEVFAKGWSDEIGAF
jgi:hypothetical protein